MTKLRWIAAAALLGSAWVSPALAQGTGGTPITPNANEPPLWFGNGWSIVNRFRSVDLSTVDDVGSVLNSETNVLSCGRFAV